MKLRINENDIYDFDRFFSGVVDFETMLSEFELAFQRRVLQEVGQALVGRNKSTSIEKSGISVSNATGLIKHDGSQVME